MKKRFGLFGIGVDIEDTGRFKKIINNKTFLEKIFTDREIEYCRRFSSPDVHFAVRFAAKEAVIKALGTANRTLSFNEIEILNKKGGAPFINIRRKSMKKKFVYYISLSHSETKAVAFSVVKGRMA